MYYVVGQNKERDEETPLLKGIFNSITLILMYTLYIYMYLLALKCINIYFVLTKLELTGLEKPFFKTSAFHEGVRFLNNCGKILGFAGQWGSGRTSIAKQVYVAVTKSSPIIISDLLTFDANKQYEPIILDQWLSKGILHAEKVLIRRTIYKLLKYVLFKIRFESVHNL